MTFEGFGDFLGPQVLNRTDLELIISWPRAGSEEYINKNAEDHLSGVCQVPRTGFTLVLGINIL
jgi:hypothetical protein